jgi:hypothetical protein
MPAFKVVFGEIPGRIIIKTIFFSGYYLISSYFFSGCFFYLNFRSGFKISASALVSPFYFDLK